MKASQVLIATALTLALGSQAMASNDVVLLDPSDLTNIAVLDISGSHNRLVIDQAHFAGGGANRVEVAINGERNGGAAAFTGTAARNGLASGTITQTGQGNAARVTVRGEDNLFSVAQIGNNNTVRGSIIGSNSQAAIAQIGNGNFTSFTQNGIGNSISVRQVSW